MANDQSFRTATSLRLPRDANVQVRALPQSLAAPLFHISTSKCALWPPHTRPTCHSRNR
ncbi:uncharacterized protein VDAG_05599 [Verticillium dahliae VdLs.17]|uniref:Uncharacterized protein n=1 Tax=Verticillium dahliae (strain VdLs.17 / ATCC MYA-4575 / FGSC 10137) TaxID=498257 RepID=G2X5U4_VERDV|nr:uncharacterized protein VDAG_05599 [Verticillium dahliae VdLs.17]EGY14435.1 hypothetical protein VDAG_05599 [Verticillium dahliae VdLs.17]